MTLTVTDASGNSSTATATVTVQQPSVASTPSLIWTGNTNTDWSECSNWSFGMVPSATHNVIIPAGLSRYPSLSAGTATITNLTGTVQTTRDLSTAGTRYTFGNLGLALTPAGTTLPGSTTIRRVTGTALTGQGTSVSIKRYYDIQAATNAGLNVALEFGYFTTELNGMLENQLMLFRSSTGTAGPWQPIGYSSRNATAHTVTTTGVDHFSIWTLDQPSNPLPVELMSFTAQAQGPDALVQWATAQEKNNAYFVVESSADGVRFQPLTRLKGQGTTATRHDYQWLDVKLARYQSTVVYYRLRQVDQDSSEQFSPVQMVQVKAQSSAFEVYPTELADNYLRYHYNSTVTSDALLTVYSAAGQLVLRQQGSTRASGKLALPTLPVGWYFVQLTSSGHHYTVRFYRP
ncbi:T9SS type A sorting domain-containing protein [Hymenobacter cavernae]|uniref:T9SS type A sorting domain-containing protein n=1 Tax=Hymenobacter cavernae TaxID=2044852 RepID=UPI001667BCDE|nr:T9SS type A sorting domain-containing protein [Hymenobacter cavernae]